MQNPTPEDLSERARNGFLYYVIPTQIYEDDRLHGDEILFYALISNLANKEGYSYASDRWLASKRQVDESSIQRWLNKLEGLGYIRRETMKAGMKWERKIFICHGLTPKVSNNVYEPSPVRGSSPYTSPQKQGDRDRKNEDIVLEVNTNRTTTTPTPSLPSGHSTTTPSRRELLRGKMRIKFGGDYREDAFENAYKELEGINPSEIKSVDGLMGSLMDKWIIFKPMSQPTSDDEKNLRIEKHRQEARQKEVDVGDFKVEAKEFVVWFINEKGSAPVSYDCTDAEWKEKTGWT